MMDHKQNGMRVMKIHERNGMQARSICRIFKTGSSKLKRLVVLEAGVWGYSPEKFNIQCPENSFKCKNVCID